MEAVIVDGELVEVIGPRAFRVKSGSQPELWYAVDLDDRGGSCTCRGYEIRKACRHLEAVRGLTRGTALTAADDPPRIEHPPLYTSRYQSSALFVQGMAPVRITLGHPRFKLGYTIAATMMELAPKGLKDVPDDDEFARLYRERLASFGVTALRRRFAQVAADYGHCTGLVLLCYEDLTKPGEFCHRRVFADWWLEQTGEEVRELGAPVPEALV